MKKYIFEVVEKDDGYLHIKRENEGFTIHELITFADDLKMDLMVIWKDIINGNIKKRITFTTDEKSGEIDKEDGTF